MKAEFSQGMVLLIQVEMNFSLKKGEKNCSFGEYWQRWDLESLRSAFRFVSLERVVGKLLKQCR